MLRRTTSRIRAGTKFSPGSPRHCSIYTGRAGNTCWAPIGMIYLLTPGMVTDDDPAPILSGMINVALDPRGRLTFFQAIPPQEEEAGNTLAAIRLECTVSRSGPGCFTIQNNRADMDFAGCVGREGSVGWNLARQQPSIARGGGCVPGQAGVLFADRALDPASNECAPIRRLRRDEERAICFYWQRVYWLWRGAALPGAPKLRSGKRRSPGRLPPGLCGLRNFNRIVAVPGTHRSDAGHTLTVLPGDQHGTFLFGSVLWILYLSLEPYVRRHWPQALVSWSRLVMGQFRDPLVGRDVLFGVILGVVWILIFQARVALMMRNGAAPDFYSLDYLIGGRYALGAWLIHIPGAIEGTLLFFFLLFVLRVLLRKEWLAAVVFVALWVALKSLGSDYPWIDVSAWALLYGVAAIVAFRFGFVALAVGLFVTDMLLNVPLTLDFSYWYATNTLLPLLSVAALAFWGFYNSLAGQKLWKTELFG